MKTTMKKICASVLAMLLVLSMGITAMADDTYTITITNTKQDQTYSAYKMFDVESYSGDETADPSTAKAVYKIKTSDDFYAFVAEGGAGASYVTLTKSTIDDDTYYVTATDSLKNDAATFAQLAVSYAKANSLTAAKTGKDADGTGSVTLDVSESGSGYYVVDTSLGALASLNTTNPTAEIAEKNDVPTVEKTVVEDSTTLAGTANTASIGDKITYVSKIKLTKTPTGIVLYDTMDAGLTYNGDVKVYTDENDTEFADTNYTTGTEGNSTFSLAFTDDALANLTYDSNGNAYLYVKYTATLNENAAITYDTATANQNKTYLTYGDNNTKTAESTTSTYTYAFDLVKTDGSDILLDGATFQLNDANNNAISFVKVANNEYRVATASETGTTDLVVKDGGACKIEGLDADTYTLVETVVPAGYNRADDTTVTITADGTAYTGTVNNAALNATIDTSTSTYTSGGVQIKNQAGSLLPSTGGIGTTILYIVGGCLVVGAVIFLITRKRMTAESNAE